MLKKFKQKLGSKINYNFLLIAAICISAGWFYFGSIAQALAVSNIPPTGINLTTNIETMPGTQDNLIRVLRGQSATFYLDVTLNSINDASGNSLSQLVFNQDNFSFKNSAGTVFNNSPILDLGAGVDINGIGNTCKNVQFGGGGDTMYTCNFSKGSNKSSATATLTVGQTYQIQMSLSQSMLSSLNINTSAPSTSAQSFLAYPYFDSNISGSTQYAIAYQGASKQIFVQFFDSQSDLSQAIASNSRPAGVPGYGSISGSTSNAGSADPITTLVTNIITGLLGLINQFIYFIFYWLIAPIIQAVLSIHVYTDAFVNVIYPGWEIIRNVCNILFIVAIIAMGMATLLRVESYQWRSLLVKLVIAALLINFSLIIAQVILALADTIQSQFLPNNVDVIRSLARDLMIANNSTQISQNTFGGNVAYVIQFMFFVSMAIGSFLVFAAIAVFLVIRIVALWVLLMLSPLAYAANILPATKSVVQKWWDEFIKYAFFTPVIAFFLNMTAVISNAARGSVLQQASTNTGSSTAFSLAPAFVGSNSPNLSGFVLTVLSNVLLLVFLVIAIKVADSMGVMGASTLSSWAEQGMKWPFSYTGNKVKSAGEKAVVVANTSRLKLANKLLKPDEKDQGTVGGFLKRQAFNLATGGSVTKAKKKAREEALHNAQHETEASAMAYKQQAKGEVMDARKKFDQEHYNGEVKKSRDRLENADVDTLADAIKTALGTQDPHARAIDLEAAMSVMLKEGLDGEVLTKLQNDNVIGQADTQAILDKAMHEGNGAIHGAESKRIAGVINRESRAKGKYQNLVDASRNVDNIEEVRQDAINKLKIEDLNSIHQDLYMNGSTGLPSDSFKQLLAAMKDESTAKDLLKKMNKQKINALKSIMSHFSATAQQDLGLNNVEFTSVRNNINAVT